MNPEKKIPRRHVIRAALTLPLMHSLLPSRATASKAQPPSQKILFDTDIGSDIDDAVALAYLLRKPGCDLLGITTVSGEAERRGRLALALCEAADRVIPVHVGIEKPLRIPQRQPHAPQAEKLTGDTIPPQHDAIAFLSETIRANPGEITLLTVGPLTNIATLFKVDPESATLLKQLVMMGGKYSDYPTPWGPTEWNAIVDPEAADIVFRSKVPQITAFGLDITWQLSMTPAEVARRFRQDRLLEMVLDWSEVWFRERALLHFHDPLAAAALFKPEICSYKRGDIAVELADGDQKGVTHFRANQSSRHQFAASVNPAAFFDEYFSVFQTRRPAA